MQMPNIVGTPRNHAQRFALARLCAMLSRLMSWFRGWFLVCGVLSVGCGRTPLDEPVPSRYLAFVADRDALTQFAPYVVDVMNEADLTPRRLGAPGEKNDYVDLAWSPDGRWLAYSNDEGYIVADADNDFVEAWRGSCSAAPVWSVSIRLAACIDSADDALRMLDANSGVTLAAIPVAGWLYPRDYAWSPAEDRLAFVRDIEGSQLSTLSILESDGEEHAVPMAALKYLRFQWSLDGRWLAFEGKDDDGESAWVVDTRQPALPPQPVGASNGQMTWGRGSLILRHGKVLSAVDASRSPIETTVISDALYGFWISRDGSVLAYATPKGLTFASLSAGRITMLSTAPIGDAAEVLIAGQNALVISQQHPKYARHVTTHGGPVSYFGSSGERMDESALSPDGRRALLALANETRSRLLRVDFESMSSHTVFESKNGIGALQWVAPQRYSFEVGARLYLGFASNKAPILLHGPYSNLRDLGQVKWQPMERDR